MNMSVRADIPQRRGRYDLLHGDGTVESRELPASAACRSPEFAFGGGLGQWVSADILRAYAIDQGDLKHEQLRFVRA